MSVFGQECFYKVRTFLRKYVRSTIGRASAILWPLDFLTSLVLYRETAIAYLPRLYQCVRGVVVTERRDPAGSADLGALR